MFTECTNNFVQVEHKVSSIESTISCVFLNQADTSEKSCCVTYRPCDQRERGSAQICNRESPYNIKLKVTDPSSKDYYYYTVTARNDSHTVKIEGTFILGIVIMV